MANSKIIINIMPWFRIGFHDRIVNTVKSGAICLTNTNYVVDDVFENGKEYLGFGLNEKEKITEKINWVIEHPGEAADIAENGQKKEMNILQWRAYARQYWKVLSISNE